ncbi:MAG: hypothetical protein AB8I08_10765 [Sandaracinaceae bacterium]
MSAPIHPPPTHRAQSRAWQPSRRLSVGLRVTLVTCALALVGLPARPAAAFTAYESFAAESMGGGGGGRFFSGSPRDGFTCAVCHTSNVEVGTPVFSEETLELFEMGYVPGQTYDIILELDTVGDAHAGVIEVTDREGNPVGTLAVPEARDNELDECLIDGVVEPAVHIQGEEQGRQVAVSDSCGEGRVYVQWTAPAMPTSGLSLYAAAVIGDGDTLPRPDPNPDPGVEPGEGDLVQVGVLQLPVAGDAPDAVRVGNACAVSGPGRAGLFGVLMTTLAGLALSLRRRRG